MVDQTSRPERAGQPRANLIRLRERLRLAQLANNETAPSIEDVRQVKYALARHRLDAYMREAHGDLSRLIEAHLDAPLHTVAIAREALRSPHVAPVLRLVGEQLKSHPDVEFSGANPKGPPEWIRFATQDEVVLIPKSVTVFWEAGHVADVPLVLQTWEDHSGQSVFVYSAADHHEAAKDHLESLLKDARGSGNPYRGQVLEARLEQGQLEFRILPAPADSRDRLILPAEVWDALDLNVHRMFARMDKLSRAGLGSNRGILLAGPPGTGKTAACRILAQEAGPSLTTIFVESRAGQYLLQQVYAEAGNLSPALVCVDAAARRAARFDQIVEFPIPSREARGRILASYLASIEHRVDLEVAADATQSLTGADLREIVRIAVLRSEEPLTTDDLLAGIDADSAARSPERKASSYI